LLIIGRRGGAAAGDAELGGATICTDRGLWPLTQRNGRAALDSRSCLPPVAAQAGGGGEASCSSERAWAPPCPVCDAGRWSCHRRFVHTPTPPQPSPARDTFPSAGLSSSSVCRKGGTHSGTVPTGTVEGQPPRRHGWHPCCGARLRKVRYGSARNPLSLTCAPRRPYDGPLRSHASPSHMLWVPRVGHMPRRAI